MEVSYTKHCEERMVKKKIEKVWVYETIKYPDKMLIKNGKNYAEKKINGGSLKVVYIKEKYLKVITVYWV
jgi:hypothetical protein